MYWVIKWKLLFDVNGITLLMWEAKNLVRKTFLVEKGIIFWLQCKPGYWFPIENHNRAIIFVPQGIEKFIKSPQADTKP